MWESEATIESEPASVPLSEIKDYAYDSAGRLTKITLPEPESGAGVPYYYYYYDNHGNQAGIVDAKLRLTVFEYDHLNRQKAKYMPFAITTAERDDLNAGTQTVYDLLSTRSPLSAQTVYDYNLRGQLEYRRHYASFADYNPLAPATNANPEIQYTYDNLGRRDQVIVDSVIEQDFD